MTRDLLLESLFPRKNAFSSEVNMTEIYHCHHRSMGWRGKWYPGSSRLLSHCLFCSTFTCVSQDAASGLVSLHALPPSTTIHTLTFSYQLHTKGSKTTILTPDSVKNPISPVCSLHVLMNKTSLVLLGPCCSQEADFRGATQKQKVNLDCLFLTTYTHLGNH